MLTWCAVASFLAAATAVVRWSRRRRDALGRPCRFPAISVSVLVLAGAAALVPVVRHAVLERSLAKVASALVGVPVAVHCQTLGEALVATDDHLGFVAEGADGRLERRTTIMREPCDALSAYRGSDHRDPSEEEVQAIHVLSHEARHMAGVLEEARAECQAMQRDAEAARLLGATEAQARRLARYYWLVLYPRMPAEYTSPNLRTERCLGRAPARRPLGAAVPLRPAARGLHDRRRSLSPRRRPAVSRCARSAGLRPQNRSRGRSDRL